MLGTAPPEYYIEYALGLSIILLRLGEKVTTTGIRGYASDDYFMLLAMVGCRFYSQDRVLSSSSPQWQAR